MTENQIWLKHEHWWMRCRGWCISSCALCISIRLLGRHRKIPLTRQLRLQKVIFSQLKIWVPARLSSSEGSVLGLQKATFLLCLREEEEGERKREGERERMSKLSGAPSYKVLTPSHHGDPTLVTSSTLNCLPIVSSLNNIVRALT